jgi:hypothetical protein
MDDASCVSGGARCDEIVSAELVSEKDRTWDEYLHCKHPLHDHY